MRFCSFVVFIFLCSCGPERSFENLLPTPVSTGVGKLTATWALFFRDHPESAPRERLPVRALRSSELTGTHQVSWLGHASVLLKFGADFVLTDPVLGERASPVSWLGPKRFHPLPIAVHDIPPLKAVLISHDHHDHLDEESVRVLAARTDFFVVPLKVGAFLRGWGVPAEKIRELEWWQSVELAGLTITCTPARHFSGRGLWGWNQTLWASFVVGDGKKRVYFGGDTGMFPGFAEIGERLGPVDLAILPIGAYDELWSAIHLFPEEALEAHRLVRGRRLLPMHFGTFDLSRHAWYEPLARLKAAAEAAGEEQALLVGAPGEVFAF